MSSFRIVLAFALGSCAPATPEEERPAGGSPSPVGRRSYAEARASRDSLSALRVSLRDSSYALDERLAFLEADSARARVREAFEADGRDVADSAAVRTFFREHIPEVAAVLDGMEELGREIENVTEGEASRSIRYRLFTECASVKLSLAGEDEIDAGSVGVVGDAVVMEMAESRMRAARIWGGWVEPDDMPWEIDDEQPLPLVLHIDDEAWEATFRKEVWDPLSGEFHVYSTWTSYSSDPRERLRQLLADATDAREGSIQLREQGLRQRFSVLIDRFILEYLRANQGYCQ